MLDDNQSNSKPSHQLVIVGGGAGGLELATRICKKRYYRHKVNVTLVDKNLTHIWKPLWHEVAAGTLYSYENEINYFLHGDANRYNFQPGELTDIDRYAKQITLAPIVNEKGNVVVAKRTIQYGTAIIAVGSVSNTFNIPGAAEHCAFLDSQEQSEAFHKQFLYHCLYIEYQNAKLTQAQSTITIIGGGATGVELAAELQSVIKNMAQLGLKHISPDNLKIILLETAGRILPTLPQRISELVFNQLQKAGIDILVNTRVTEITQEGIQTQQAQFIPSEIKIWAAGIRAPAILSQLNGLEVNRLNQLLVKPTLQTTIDDSIFAIGDCAECPQPGESQYPVPPRAQAASQEAKFLAKFLWQHLSGKSLPNFHYRDYGSLITLSHRTAIGYIARTRPKQFYIEGKLAQFFYWNLLKKHQVVLFGFWHTALLTLMQLFTQKTITRLKLH